MQSATVARGRRHSKRPGPDVATPGRPRPVNVKTKAKATREARPVPRCPDAPRLAAPRRVAPRDGSHSRADGADRESPLHPGPRSFQDTMDDWQIQQRRALSIHAPGSTPCLEDVSARGLDVTTHYSGTGAAEMATAKVFPGRVRFHSACDISPTACVAQPRTGVCG